jgi:ammonium transporter Rh
LTAFALSGAMNKHQKFVMEHIQNATLAGGVAIGAVADLMVGPWAALTIGSIAAIISVLGYDILSPFLKKRFKIHDTCGVHNLHGMPGVLGSLISCIVVSFASKELYRDSLNDIFAYIGKDVENSYGETVKYTAHDQAVNQFLAFLVTMVFAIFGGLMTGFILKAIGHVQELDKPREGTTVMKMAASIQGSIASVAGFQ